jgi:anti-sigma28 factor (negative regulator of flagellin synthesis)
VISEAQTVAVTAHITDNLSGFLSGSIEFRSPNGQRVTEAAQFTKLSGTATDGMYEAKVTFKRYIMPGPWKVTALHMVDNVENGITLGSRRIAAKGFPTTIEVESIEDEAPPSLVGLSISPSSVNVMSESKSVNVGAHITDDKSGVASASITFESPNGKQTTARAAFTKVSGTEIDGMWEATVTFEQFIQSGTWKVKSVHLEDNVGNKADLGAVLLEGKGLPTTVQVESNEDTAPPALATLSFAPTPVNVESTNQTMTVTAEITDNLSGFASGSVVFESPSGKVITNVASFLKVSGTATKGIYEAKVAFKRFIQKGTWKVSNVNLVDKVGNEVNLSASQLEGKALPATVNVESIEDTEPPALAGLTITPRTIDTATSNEDVIVIAHITDNLSGFNKGFITFESENGKHQTGQSNLNVKLSGTETDGSWEGVAVFKQTLESGTWKVSSMVLTDNAGNEISYSAAQLEAKGFPATVVDETSAPPTVRKLSPKKGLAGGGTKVTVGFSVTNPDKLTATSPEGTTGVVDLTVTTPNGTSAITTHDHFKYAAPTVTEVTPNHGPKAGGTEVTITGTGFALGSSGTTFKVGGVMASHVNCVSRSSCTAKTPPGSKLGGVNVIAIVGGKKSASNPGDIFKYT